MFAAPRAVVVMMVTKCMVGDVERVGVFVW